MESRDFKLLVALNVYILVLLFILVLARPEPMPLSLARRPLPFRERVLVVHVNAEKAPPQGDASDQPDAAG